MLDDAGATATDTEPQPAALHDRVRWVLAGMVLGWSAVFITLGYVLGEEWNRVLQTIDDTKFLMIGAGAAAVAAWLVFTYWRRRKPLSQE